jgi:BED zinc finger
MQNKDMKDQFSKATIANCQYCDRQFTGQKPTSALYRHIRSYAKKPAEKRGNHPTENSKDFSVLSAKFRPPTKSSIEAAARRALSQRNYKKSRKAGDRDKVCYAIDSLK